MTNKLRWLALLTLHIGLAVAIAGPAVANTVSDVEQRTLDAIRVAMAKRDLDEAKMLLLAAEKNGSPSYSNQLERLDLIHDYLGQFWQAVSDGAQTLKAVDEIVVGKTRASVVEVSRERIVLRVAGRNRRYGLDDMPPKLAITLAERRLADDKQNLVFFATFHLADKAGDKKEAERLLSEAKRAGVDIISLWDEISSDRPAVADIEIPELTPVMRSLLSPARWITLTNDGSRVRRASLKVAEQNNEGRLVIAPEDHARTIAFSTKLAANFGCRLVLQCEAKGLIVGLHSNSDPNKSVGIEIPAGTSVIEIARQRGEWQCRLNGQSTEVELNSGAAANISGHLGFSLPQGHACTIAAIELRTR